MYDAGMNSIMKLPLMMYSSYVGTKVRIGYAQLCNSEGDADDLDCNKSLTEFENVYQDSVKLVADGSNQGLTGYQSKPYCCEPAETEGDYNFPSFSRLEQMTPDSDMVSIVKTIIGKGWLLMIHSNGDKAIALTLQAYNCS